MRYLLMLWWIPLGLHVSGAIPVIDLSVLAQTAQQVMIATQQLQNAKDQLDRIGNPLDVAPAMTKDVMRGFAEAGRLLPGDELQSMADGIAGVLFEGNGLYRAPGQSIRRADGLDILRATDAYRKFDAVNVTRQAWEVVAAEAEERARQVRNQTRATLAALQKASTMAEVAKLHALLTAQSSLLASIEKERESAMAQILVQQLGNQTDAERQALARQEEHREAFRQAHQKIGEFLVPETSPVVIPDPNRP
jgi:hypothetical protein